MTRDVDTRRPPPQPAICPNGHPNRPGTRICAVCRALIPPPAAPVVAAPATTAPADPPPPAAPRPSRAAYWALGLVLVLLALAVALFALYWPIRRRFDYLATAAVVTLPAAAAEVASATPAPPTATPQPPTATPPPTATAGANASLTPVATITPLATIVGVVLAPTVAAASATPTLGPNLIQNGDFSADWVNGWERTAEGVTGVQTVEARPPTGEPPLPALFMSKSGAGALRLSQSITLAEPADGLVFRGRLRLAGAPAGTAEGRGALLLLYEDADGRPLGASVWLDGSAPTSGLWGEGLPPFGPTLAPRFLPADWQTVEIALAHEFTDRLPDVDPAAVRRITVVLAVLGSADCPPDACVAELSAATLTLAPAEPRP